MDVRTAFLNGTINEEIFMEIPKGFPRVGDNTKVHKINKALYGLNQSSQRLGMTTSTLGFMNKD